MNYTHLQLSLRLYSSMFHQTKIYFENGTKKSGKLRVPYLFKTIKNTKAVVFLELKKSISETRNFIQELTYQLTTICLPLEMKY